MKRINDGDAFICIWVFLNDLAHDVDFGFVGLLKAPKIIWLMLNMKLGSYKNSSRSALLRRQLYTKKLRHSMAAVL
jgi:hypothetical protein